ncbi:carbon monoxide dehydrogenase subunit G [Paraburkholderia sp. J63]|uniref:SRPBCC family protein n=1 Tax=Paraburkholderia sp. J63 TaxID=2805434 RepID=UPI002ABD9518|nr:carbon monoxide dehydrogenase subunit G [Paraburkholderia sp. J63]
MDLTGEQLLPMPRERVFDALLDPVMLQAAIPGCKSITSAGDGAYDVAVVTAIGPVKAQFKGRLRLENPQRPQGYVMSFEGDGGVAGFARGSAEVTLEALDEQQTRLRYAAKAQIGGRLAQIGARLVDASAAKLSAQFFGRFTELLGAPEGAAARAGQPEAASVAAPAAAVTAGVSREAPGQPLRGMVTLQMPAWTWAFTIAALAALAGWYGAH